METTAKKGRQRQGPTSKVRPWTAASGTSKANPLTDPGKSKQNQTQNRPMTSAGRISQKSGNEEENSDQRHHSKSPITGWEDKKVLNKRSGYINTSKPEQEELQHRAGSAGSARSKSRSHRTGSPKIRSRNSERSTDHYSETYKGQMNEIRDTKHWAVTALDHDDTDEEECLKRVTPVQDLGVPSQFEDEVESVTQSEETVPKELVELPSETPSSQDRTDSWHKWVQGSESDSDDYNTDLEEDFPPEPDIPSDGTGKHMYEAKCKENGVVPVSYLVRHLGEGTLRMRHHYLGGDATKPLARALKDNTVCEEIDLSDNYIEGSGATALAKTLKENMFIVNLNISNNFIRSDGAEAFSEMLEANTTLKTLSLQGNQLTDSDAKRISEALKNNMSLSCLDLSHNQFGEMGGIFLAAGLASNIGLSDLDLSWNGIRGKGAVSIAKALVKNQSLEILDLSWNGFGDTGALALAQTLKTNRGLKVLDISNNRIGLEAAKKLGLGVTKNEGLETLLMGMNPMGDAGADAIIKGVTNHPRIKLIGIEDVSLSENTFSRIKELQESRDIMVMYTYGSPQQSRLNRTVLAVFERFLSDNSDSMQDLFNQMDKDKSGDVTLEELKYGLKDFGLRLTSKQLDLLLDELDADKSGTIEYHELLDGSALVSREKERLIKAEKEAMIIKAGIPVS